MQVNPLTLDRHRVTLILAAVAETGTAFALLIEPAFVSMLIWGAPLAVVAPALARCFGIALTALALRCWSVHRDAGGTSSLQAMLLYNAIIAVYLTYLGAALRLSGPLLWPAVLFHVGVAISLAWPLRRER